MAAAPRAARPADVPVQVYTPQRLRLPAPRTYLADLWARRRFALELARTELRASNTGTLLGQLWLVLNPLLLVAVYYVLVDILRSDDRGTPFLAHLAACLFAFHLVTMAVRTGARSVTSSGKLILNTAFPRSLLPITSVLSALVRFVPTMVVYAVLHLVAGLPVGVHLLWALPVLAEIAVFTLGVTLLVAALQVYVRDLTNFLPYLLRVWLYVSPILYYADEVPARLVALLSVNPLFPLLAAWSDVLIRGHAPTATHLLQGLAWALGSLVVGALFFVSREREFAVRL
ncbi:MAG: ABC transporter permease [Actinomycetota bacterium]|nr:ABC transporter permease [Actinomycetota bacterium]